MLNRRQLRTALVPGRDYRGRVVGGHPVRPGGHPVVTRRSEIPSLNRAIKRSIRYEASRDDFGGQLFDHYETSARCRRLDLTAKDQLSYSEGKTLDRPVRRYLVRPVKGSINYQYNEGNPKEETRILSLEWTTSDNTFIDDGVEWTVRGVGHYDSAGRMLELVVRGAPIT